MFLQTLTFGGRLHICSLAAQLLATGLLLYSQAHIGQLQPFFLTAPLTGVSLYGILVPDGEAPIVVERRQLACLGDMVGDSVFVFRSPRTRPATPNQHAAERLYLHGSCSQLVDLWGPGCSVSNMEATSRFYRSNLLAFYIRGGFIRPDTKVGKQQLFHWSLRWEDTASVQTFSYWEDILIGTLTECHPVSTDEGLFEETTLTGVNPLPSIPAASAFKPEICHIPRPPVVANGACPLIVADSRRESEPFLSSLGTSPDWWSMTEIQGMAAVTPPYFMVQGAFSMTKQSGISLKHVLLDRWVGDETFSLFDEPWALQVSLCTGVARRVPVRALIEEPLIAFADSLNIPGWTSPRQRAIAALCAEAGFSAWAAELNLIEPRCMRTVLGRLLHVLKDTGFDPSGKYFSILWPHGGEARFCVRIRPEKDKEQLWCSILQDSEWYATFAVLSSQCLETGAHLCRGGPAAPWRGGAMLSTVVCPNFTGGIPRLASGSFFNPFRMQDWQLQHNEPYWVGKQGSQIWVVVRKGTRAVTELQVTRNRFPTSAFLWPDRVLREKPDVTFCGEDVFVLNR